MSRPLPAAWATQLPFLPMQSVTLPRTLGSSVPCNLCDDMVLQPTLKLVAGLCSQRGQRAGGGAAAAAHPFLFARRPRPCVNAPPVPVLSPHSSVKRRNSQAHTGATACHAKCHSPLVPGGWQRSIARHVFRNSHRGRAAIRLPVPWPGPLLVPARQPGAQGCHKTEEETDWASC